MEAHEFMTDYLKIDRCVECHCCVGNDWEYAEFSSKAIVECAQCKARYYDPEIY